MRKVLLSAAFTAATIAAGIATPARAQENPDQMSIRVAGYEVLLNGKVSTPHLPRHRGRYYGGRIGLFEVGFNGFHTPPGAYSAYPASEAGFMDLRVGKSIQVTLNMFTFSASLARNNVLGVTAAIGFTANNYTFVDPTAFTKIDRMIRPADAGHALKKSKLNTFAIHLPLALEVNPNRNFFFSAGGYVDLITGSHMKWKRPKEKLRGLSTNFIHAGVTARVGFKNAAAYIYGSYDFVEMVQKGHGPVLNPYTVGIGFGF
jgi:hypothetical protein